LKSNPSCASLSKFQKRLKTNGKSNTTNPSLAQICLVLTTNKTFEEAMPRKTRKWTTMKTTLGLEPGDVEEEIIELEDGSVVVNYQEKQSPRKNPEFYENLAEVFDEGALQATGTRNI